MKEELNNRENLRELIERAKGTDEYFNLMMQIRFLKMERVIIVGNELRKKINRPETEVDTEEIIETCLKINGISRKLECTYRIPTKWEEIELYLRYTVLEDIENEFEKQANQ